jgi:hypothetical protein
MLALEKETVHTAFNKLYALDLILPRMMRGFLLST